MQETVRYPEFHKLRYKLDGYGNFMTNQTDMVEKVRRNSKEMRCVNRKILKLWGFTVFLN